METFPEVPNDTDAASHGVHGHDLNESSAVTTTMEQLDATLSSRIAAESSSQSSMSTRREMEECFVIASDIDEIPEPDYGLGPSVTEEREQFEQQHQQQGQYHDQEDFCDEGSGVASSPDYDYLGYGYEETDYPVLGHEDAVVAVSDAGESTQLQQEQQQQQQKKQEAPQSSKETLENEYEYIISDDGEEYILGTLMVRVLQARNVKFHHSSDGGGIASLLSNHRRNRRQKYTMSPLSGSSGSLTPNSSQYTLYGKLMFKSQLHYTESAVSGMNGDFYWSRGDQSYFDVVCPSYQRMTAQYQTGHGAKVKKEQELSKEKEKYEDVCCKPNKLDDDVQKPPSTAKADTISTPPILHLSLYSKRGSAGNNKVGKQGMMSTNKKVSSFDHNHDEDNQFVGKCSINISRVLTGKTPYFDEWCTIHNDTYNGLTSPHDHQDDAGRVRVVIEYEPTDPPPRTGDICVFANIYPSMERELYPVPLYTIRTSDKPVTRSGSSTSFDRDTSTSCTTMSSIGSSSVSSKSVPATASHLIRQPKQFHVEDIVGDHVVLSYQTPENWNATFEIHRYNLLVMYRHCGTVEKVKEHVLDFCDNISQSPMVNVLSKTVEILPDEGLVYVGAEAVGEGLSLLGRWMEVGLAGALEDVVDATNLDGRYSHFSDDEEDEPDDIPHESRVMQQQQQQQMNSDQVPGEDVKSAVGLNLDPPLEEKEALPGMPCCPITGLPSKFFHCLSHGFFSTGSTLTFFMFRSIRCSCSD
ncbi:hypothetical protein HJC23_012022 [Cyclotella cryptica]|uniref:C2 domain-containing protein n=1 Tax=Cyclotella cryptica TaxID=29204 RepID=A0ABD3NF85_9STRA